MARDDQSGSLSGGSGSVVDPLTNTLPKSLIDGVCDSSGPRQDRDNRPGPIKMPRPGEEIAEGWKLGEQIGIGGSGVVFTASHKDRGRVAVKMLDISAAQRKYPTHLSSILGQRRAVFFEQIDQLIEVVSPHVVKVISSSVYKQVPFYFMEYLDSICLDALHLQNYYFYDYVHDTGISEKLPYQLKELFEQIEPLRDIFRLNRGEDLRSKLERWPKSPIWINNALDYVIQSLKGVEAFHQKGICHGDLKPGNLFCTTERKIKVLDPGCGMRTSLYASPEQICSNLLTPQSDIYSIGVVLYELLTHALPFRSVDEIRSLEPPIQVLRNGKAAAILPEAVESIIARALAKDPADRFGTAQEFREALEKIQKEVEPHDRLERSKILEPVSNYHTQQWSRKQEEEKEKKAKFDYVVRDDAGFRFYFSVICCASYSFFMYPILMKMYHSYDSGVLLIQAVLSLLPFYLLCKGWPKKMAISAAILFLLRVFILSSDTWKKNIRYFSEQMPKILGRLIDFWFLSIPILLLCIFGLQEIRVKNISMRTPVTWIFLISLFFVFQSSGFEIGSQNDNYESKKILKLYEDIKKKECKLGDDQFPQFLFLMDDEKQSRMKKEWEERQVCRDSVKEFGERLLDLSRRLDPEDPLRTFLN